MLAQVRRFPPDELLHFVLSCAHSALRFKVILTVIWCNGNASLAKQMSVKTQPFRTVRQLVLVVKNNDAQVPEYAEQCWGNYTSCCTDVRADLGPSRSREYQAGQNLGLLNDCQTQHKTTNLWLHRPVLWQLKYDLETTECLEVWSATCCG